MGTPDGQNGYIFSKPQPIHPTHDTTYVQVLAPPESAGPIALFLIVQIPELVAILHETRGELTLQQKQSKNIGKNMGKYTLSSCFNFEMKAITIHVFCQCV